MILKKMLDAKKIEYGVEDNPLLVAEKAREVGIQELPILAVVDDEETVYSGSEAVMYGKEL